MSLDYENWLLDEQARSLLEHHYGWYEPTWDDLQQEHFDCLDREADHQGAAGVTYDFPSVPHTGLAAAPLSSRSGRPGPTFSGG